MIRAIVLLLLAMPGFRCAELTVDLQRTLGPATQRACGFLHGITGGSPDAALLEPLKIRYVRGRPHAGWGLPGLLDTDVAQRLQRPGLRLALGVYYYDKKQVAGRSGQQEYWPGDQDDWTSWEAIVAGTVREASARKLACHWVLWNEPDHPRYWQRDNARFLETWRRAYRVVKDLDPQAIITGPTITRYSLPYLTAFLTYCRDHGCVPDLVTWHELTRTEQHIRANVTELKAWCAQQAVPIKGVVIDEYGGKGAQHLPGPAVGFLSALEAAQVAFASRAIWTASGSLCGATTADGRKPLALWWVYKAYSDITGTLCEVQETAEVRAVAGFDRQPAVVAVLVGNQSPQEQRVRLMVRSAAMLGIHKATIIRRLMPEAGQEPLVVPEALPVLTVAPVDGAFAIELGPIPGHGAMEVRIHAD